MLPEETQTQNKPPHHGETLSSAPSLEAAALADARWRALEQATGQITWIINAQGQSLDSVSWCRFTGQVATDARLHWIDAVHPDDRALVMETWVHAFATQEPYSIEYRIRRADGVYRVFEVRGIPVFAESGALREWVGACTDVTERSQAQQDLLATQEKHRLLFETTTIGILYQDAATMIQSANPAAERLLGVPHDQLIGRKTSDTQASTIHENGTPFPGPDHPASKALRSGKPVTDVVMGIPLPGANGYRWLNVSAIPHFHPGEARPYQVFVTFEDISERLQLRHNIHDALTALLDIARMLVTEDQPAGQTLANGILDHLTQLLLSVMNCHTVGVIHLDQLTYIMHPMVFNSPYAGYKDRYLQVTDGIPLTNFLTNRQMQRLRKGKSIVYHHQRLAERITVLLIVPLCIANELSGILTIDYGTASHDFTAWEKTFVEAVAHLLAIVHEREQLRGESALRTSQFAGLFETISDGVAVYDLGGHFVAMNQAMRDLYGYTTDPISLHESISERIANLKLRDTHGKLVGKDLLGLANILQGEVITSSNAVEMIATRMDGRDIQVSITGAPIRDAHGKITGVVTVTRDITERARLDQMKDDFINIASHELRAPLTPVILACRFIQRAMIRPEQATKLERYAGEIVTQAKRLSRLVDDMLDMTRITNNHFVIELAPCNLAQTILDAIEEQRAIWHRTIFDEGLTSPITTLADAERIWQVMTNLLSNAIKYSPASEPIFVRAEQLSDHPGGMLRITVQDRGPGIPLDAQARIFERFYRLPDSDPTQPRHNGLGLGLFITRAIVEAHGGHIHVESPDEGGIAFVVELPFTPLAE